MLQNKRSGGRLTSQHVTLADTIADLEAETLCYSVSDMEAEVLFCTLVDPLREKDGDANGIERVGVGTN